MTDRSSAGEARRSAMAMAQSLGFDEGRRSDIGIVATEVATNIILHAGTGEVLLCPFQNGRFARMDILALDNGPGIPNVPQAFEDGYSTIGTAGQGLGAVQRISDAFSLYSHPQKGTVLWSRFITENALAERAVFSINIPMKGETACGDASFVAVGPERSVFMVADGLGHGRFAAEAAEEAVLTVRMHADLPPAEIVLRTHDALRKTRGAAMSIAVADHERKTISYAGVGNISAVIVTAAATRTMISQNGTLGATLSRVQEYNYPFDERSILMMYSDGMSSKCSMSGYPGLHNRPLELIAGVLYRDFSRRRDDATVLLASLGGDVP